MNYLDLSIIIILALSFFIGYRHGFFKELYNVILLILSILFSFLFKNLFGNLTINFLMKALENRIENEQIFQILKSVLSSAIGLIVAYFVFYIIFKIILIILVKKDVLPSDADFLRYGGASISLLKSIFILSTMIFALSFLSYANIDYYDKSLLAKPILMLDPPLYKLSNKFHLIVNNILDMMKNVNKYQSDPNIIFTDPKSEETIKSLFETGIINDDVLIEASKNALKNVDTAKLKLDEINYNEVKNTEQFIYLKKLYKDNIIDDNLIKRFVEENNLTELDITKLIDALKE